MLDFIIFIGRINYKYYMEDLFIIWDQHDSNCFYHLLHHHHLSVLLILFSYSLYQNLYN